MLLSSGKSAVDAEDYRLAAEHYEQAEEHERLGEEEDAYIEKIGDHFYDSEDYYGAWNWYKKSGNLARQTGRAQNAIGLSYIRKNGKQPDFVQPSIGVSKRRNRDLAPPSTMWAAFISTGTAFNGTLRMRCTGMSRPPRIDTKIRYITWPFYTCRAWGFPRTWIKRRSC